MTIPQCVLITLAATLVPVRGVTSPIVTIQEITTQATSTSMIPDLTTTSDRMTTTSATPDFTNENATTQPMDSTYVERHTTTTEPKVPQRTRASTLGNGLALSSTWIIVIAVGIFTVVTVLPLVIIMILIVALGCVCKTYRRLKKRLNNIVSQEIVASNNYGRDLTTNTMEGDVVLKNIVMLQDIDTDDNVAYGQVNTVVDSHSAGDTDMTMQDIDENYGTYVSVDVYDSITT